MLSKYQANVINILLVGFVLSAGVFFISLSWQKSYIEREFKHQSSIYVELIKHKLSYIDSLVHNNRSFIEFGVNNVNGDDKRASLDFIPIVEASLYDLNSLVSFTWFPLERGLKHVVDGRTTIHMKRNHRVGSNNGGLNNSDAYFNQLIQQIDSKLLFQAFVMNDVVDVVGVVFDQEQPPYATSIESIGNPVGYFLTRWDLGMVIENALSKIPASGLDLMFAKVLSDTDKLILYTHNSRSRSVSKYKRSDSELHYSSSPFGFAGASWQLSFKDAPYFLDSRPHVLPWILLAFGVFLSVVFAMRTDHINRQYDVVKKEVDERTKALILSEEKLRQSKNRYSTLIEMSHVGIVVHVDGIIRYANPYIADKLGTKTGDDILKFIMPEYRERFQQYLLAVKNNDKGHLQTEERYLLKSGSVMDGEDSSTVIEYEGERAVLMLIRDVTEQKLVSAKLQHIDRIDSLGVLAGGIAHDFNNLLAAAMGSASLLEEYIAIGSPGRKHLDTICSASEVAAELCNQMLAYSGKGEFVLQAVDLSHCIKDMRSLIHASTPKHIKLSNQLHAVPTIMADITQIHQLILNLTINAVESMSSATPFSSQKQEVRVRTGVENIASPNEFRNYIGTDSFEPGEFVYFDISDNGCGISKEAREKMFDPYFSTKGAGRGLGMSALLGILKGHRGGMRITSTVGQGTDIRVIFPAVSKQLKLNPSESQGSSEKLASPLRSGLVLIIDDEFIVRKTASLMCRKLGFDVITANDGIEGIKSFKQAREIKFVLLDLMMPNMGGEECFYELRKLQSDLCIILSSGYSGETIGVPMDYFLKKPYTLKGLVEAIDSVL